MKFGQWLGFVCLITSIYILWQIRQILLLVFTAVVLSTALNRLVRRFQNLGIKQRGLALALTLSLTLLILALFILLIVPPFIDQFQQLIQLVPDVWLRLIKQLRELETQLPTTIPNFSDLESVISQIQPFVTNLLRNFYEFFQNSLAVVLKLLLVLVLTVMLLANPQEYREGCLKLFPSFYRKRAREIFDSSEEALGNWLGAITIDCIFIGTLSGIGLSIIGIKLLLAHALLAGLLNFIPNIGPATSVIFPVMVALLDDPWKIIAILIWYFVIQNIETYWLTPKLMKERASLLPAVTLFAQIFFASTFGLLGLLLALPLTVVAKTWIEEVLFKDILDRWEVQENMKFSSVIPLSIEDSETKIETIKEDK
ncbi:MAG: AI-2E family transporter [Prochloraceae cyanobacterium]